MKQYKFSVILALMLSVLVACNKTDSTSTPAPAAAGAASLALAPAAGAGVLVESVLLHATSIDNINAKITLNLYCFT